MTDQNDNGGKGDNLSPRRANGQFAKGHTIKGGRPPRSKRIPHPESFRDRAYAIAEYKIASTINGKPVKVTLWEANLFTLGLNGAKGDGKSAGQYLNFTFRSLEQELRFMREELARVLSGEPSWMNEPNPEKRAKLKKDWLYAIGVAQGRRETWTPSFPTPKRQRKKSPPKA